MARAPRVQIPGLYHITTRGNNGAPVFRDDTDNRRFKSLLQRVATLLDWRVHLWCLMTTHYHLLIEIKSENLAWGMQLLNGRYAQAFNRRYGCSGHVFERRYASRLIESETQLRNTATYIAYNPVAAGLTEDARDWRGSGGPMLPAALEGR